MVGIDQDLVVRYAEVFQKDIELFGEVDVDGRVGRDNVFVSYGSSAHLLVIALGNRSDHHIEARAGLCDCLEDLGVFLIVGGAPNDQGHVDRLGHLLGHFGRVLCGEVLAVGVSSCKPQADYIGLVFIDAFLGPCHRIAQHVLEGLQGLLRPFFRLNVEDLEGQFRRIGHFPFEGVKIVPGLSADNDFTSRLSNFDFTNFSGILYLWQFSHLPPSLTELIYKTRG